MAADHAQPADLDLTEKLARINLINADTNRKNQEFKLAPIQLVLTAMGSGAALFAAALAFFKVLNLG